MKQVLFWVAALTLSFSISAAEIRNVTARQRYPWNGKVDIAYEVVGDVTAGMPAGKMPEIVVTAKDKETSRIYEAKASALSGDMGCGEGCHYGVWDLDAQGLELTSQSVVFGLSVLYVPNPSLQTYCIVDLSAGSNASSYPVSYCSEPPAGGFNTDEYKTTKLVLRRVDPGSFKMCGQYDVTLTKPFYCGLFEVTQQQYGLVIGDNPSTYLGDTRPVENVSWEAIRGGDWPLGGMRPNSGTFVGRLQARTGLSFDLPTEAQWEYACRAGTTSDYNNGGDSEDDLKLLGRYGGNRDDGKGGYAEHTIVGSYLPNAWGLYDMHGNVCEWCLDWYGELTAGVTDPGGLSSGSRRVIRGGYWSYSAINCTSSSRLSIGPASSYYGFGFRLVCPLAK